MKKTIEQIHKETPLSLTGTDNPIVRINERGHGASVLHTNKTDKPAARGLLYELNRGEDYRFIDKGCKLGDGFSALRLGENDAIWVPNDCFDLIHGVVVGINVFEEVDHDRV